MAGRKGEKWWRDAIRLAITEQLEGDPSGRTKLRAAADALVSAAIAGDVSAIKEIGDRLDGKATQQHEHTGGDGGPLETVQKIILVDGGSSD